MEMPPWGRRQRVFPKVKAKRENTAPPQRQTRQPLKNLLSSLPLLLIPLEPGDKVENFSLHIRNSNSTYECKLSQPRHQRHFVKYAVRSKKIAHDFVNEVFLLLR